MTRFDDRSDEELLDLAAREVDALATFYRRHERRVLAFFMRATRSSELAADLTAETFATVLGSLERFDPELGTGQGWLFGIARHLLARSRSRGQVENRARRRLGMAPLALDDHEIERIEAELGGEEAARTLLAGLSDTQRAAVEARVLDERTYGEIAAELRCSESVVRKRVSRGLSTLRRRLKEER